jgi:thiol:disulfide interchange protein
MATDFEPGTGQQSFTGLARGIFRDAEELIKQQFALFRYEVRDDLHKLIGASISLAIGAALGLVGVILLCFGCVYLLSWLAPTLPLWACYGIVGLVFVIMCGILVAIGVSRIRSLNPLANQSAQALKETMQWKTTPR